MRTVRLMADYECHPLWNLDERVGNVPPNDLEISAVLAADLDSWADAYMATLNRDDPRLSGFIDADSARTWLATGSQLATRLRDEGFLVDYAHGQDDPQAMVAQSGD